MWQQQLAFKFHPKVQFFISLFCSFLHSKFPSSQLNPTHIITIHHTWTDNKVHELIAVKVLHTSLLKTTAVAFKVLPLGSYGPMPVPSPPFKTILEQVVWNGFQNCCCITPDVINVIKCLPFNISFIFGNRKKSLGARSSEQTGYSNTVICLVAKNSLIDSAV